MSKLRRQLKSGTVWSAKDDMSPLDGLRREVDVSSAATLQEWGEELLTLLKDKDLVLRTRAIAALDLLPADPVAVLNLLQTSPELFDEFCEGYPLFPPSLDEAIWFWLSEKPEVALAVRKRLSVQPDLVVYLASHDYDWVLEHANRVVFGEVLGGVLISFPKECRADLLKKLGPFDDAGKILKENWWKRVEDSNTLRDIVAGWY